MVTVVRREWGEKYSPSDVTPLSTRWDSPSPGSGPTDSCDSGEREEAPCPAQGIMFSLCYQCGVDLGSVAVALGDDANGGVSHGYCPPCAGALSVEIEAGADEDERRADLEVESFLKGLGLIPIQGVWVALLVPWALLAAQAVGR